MAIPSVTDRLYDPSTLPATHALLNDVSMLLAVETKKRHSHSVRYDGNMFADQL